jgi:hypothetical protein
LLFNTLSLSLDEGVSYRKSGSVQVRLRGFVVTALD